MPTATATATPNDAPAPRPAPLRLERRADGRLWAGRGGELRPVDLVQCFPWSCPGRHLSLRDESGHELALIDDPADLDPPARAAVEAALAETGFVLRIERVLSVVEEIEIRTWQVVTAQGPRRFQTAREHWPRQLDGGSLLVRDVAGDLYLIAAPAALDAASRAALWAFVDV